MARASWLSSDDPARFADAMMKCRHPGGYCAADGRCHLAGDCFRPPRGDVLDERLKRIEARLARLEARDVTG